MNLKRRGKLISALAIVTTLAAVWFIGNPPGQFGWSCYAYTTYSACPRPLADFQIRADGSIRKVSKTHELSFEQIEWLLEPKPTVLIIALGWDGVTTPDDRIREYKDCEIHVLRNRPAIELFNKLKRSGTRVAIHYHSTC